MILGGRYFGTMAERVAHVKQRLAIKYARLLAIPAWTEGDLGELENDLGGYVLNGLDRLEELRFRLNYKYGLGDDLEALTPRR